MSEEEEKGFFKRILGRFKRKSAETGEEPGKESGKKTVKVNDKESAADQKTVKLSGNEGAEEEGEGDAPPRSYSPKLIVLALVLFLVGTGAGVWLGLHFFAKEKTAAKTAPVATSPPAAKSAPAAAAKSAPVPASAPVASSAPQAAAASSPQATPPQGAKEAKSAKPAPPPDAGDCGAVGSKEGAGEALRRCIEFFNASTGRR